MSFVCFIILYIYELMSEFDGNAALIHYYCLQFNVRISKSDKKNIDFKTLKQVKTIFTCFSPLSLAVTLLCKYFNPLPSTLAVTLFYLFSHKLCYFVHALHFSDDNKLV